MQCNLYGIMHVKMQWCVFSCVSLWWSWFWFHMLSVSSFGFIIPANFFFLKSVPIQWFYRSSLSWANSLIIHEIMCIQQISLTLIFLTIIYFPFAKVRSIINHLMLRVYYLLSEELTSTPKFRKNLLEKTHEHWA